MYEYSACSSDFMITIIVIILLPLMFTIRILTIVCSTLNRRPAESLNTRRPHASPTALTRPRETRNPVALSQARYLNQTERYKGLHIYEIRHIFLILKP